MGTPHGPGFLLIVFVAAAACQTHPAPEVRPPTGDRSSGTTTESSPAIVGTWRVVKFCDDDATGRLSDPYGASPTGYFVYTPTGELSIQAMRSPPVRPYVSGDDRPTDAERKELLDSYFGYFGTYTVTSDSTVVHHVQGGTIPSYIGTDQPREYQIRGDTLTIGGSRVTWPCRVLIRVRHQGAQPNKRMKL